MKLFLPCFQWENTNSVKSKCSTSVWPLDPIYGGQQTKAVKQNPTKHTWFDGIFKHSSHFVLKLSLFKNTF